MMMMMMMLMIYRWIIASGHRPYYTSGGVCSSCADAFESLFNKYDVDIYFSGHVHWYERLYAIAPGIDITYTPASSSSSSSIYLTLAYLCFSGGEVVSTDYVNPTAPIYIVNGAAGNVEGHSTGTKKAYTALIDNTDYGYGKLSVNNRTSLTWQYFKATDKSLVDEIAIYKEH